MPPVADKHLEERILKAGQRLWRTRGGAGFTLREIARAAGTTTPTIYQRFQNKEALLKALALRVRDALNAELFSAPTLEEACRRYLQYVEKNPREYTLINEWWPNAAPDLPRPGRAWLLSKVAARFGGQPEEYDQVFYALLFLLHGAASMLTVMDANSLVYGEIRDNCLRACDKLIENVAIFRSPVEQHDFNGS